MTHAQFYFEAYLSLLTDPFSPERFRPQLSTWARWPAYRTLGGRYGPEDTVNVVTSFPGVAASPRPPDMTPEGGARDET